MEAKIINFFRQYERRFNDSLKDNADVEGTIACFGDYFIEASPTGLTAGKNDEAFRKSIPEGYAFYKSIGTQSMKILAIDVHKLDNYHAMAKIHWLAHYASKNKRTDSIDFDVIYLLQVLTEEPKIFAYITGDEQKILREKGLIPEQLVAENQKSQKP
jgi:hypothetical protein